MTRDAAQQSADDRDGVDRIVEQWARERPDLETTAMSVFGRIFRLSRLAGDRMEKAYAAFGIGRPEFDVLATLRRAGDPYQLSPGELAASMMLSTGGTTARLDRLERAGMIERLPSPTDRRGVLVRLTPQGFDVIEQAVGAGLAEQRRMLAHLPQSKQRQLDALLREALAGVRTDADVRWLGANLSVRLEEPAGSPPKPDAGQRPGSGRGAS
ncbi:MarR family winged helix-turn-helix transcriptional regulator [Actinoplanes sp. URMC 104]|uniref:MarR family winged helix-turn-helix transcriptional regulator n=1 Tax=Actinoplanes sp. URMC 104 TaxID=3423409 RepID=UPI003F195352